MPRSVIASVASKDVHSAVLATLVTPMSGIPSKGTEEGRVISVSPEETPAWNYPAVSATNPSLPHAAVKHTEHRTPNYTNICYSSVQTNVDGVKESIIADWKEELSDKHIVGQGYRDLGPNHVQYQLLKKDAEGEKFTAQIASAEYRGENVSEPKVIGFDDQFITLNHDQSDEKVSEGNMFEDSMCMDNADVSGSKETINGSAPLFYESVPERVLDIVRNSTSAEQAEQRVVSKAVDEAFGEVYAPEQTTVYTEKNETTKSICEEGTTPDVVNPEVVVA